MLGHIRGFVAFFLLGMAHLATAQERCGTQALLQLLSPEQRQHAPGGVVFEQQLRQTLSQTNARTGLALCDSGKVFKIPVVFHIIHNGEAIGTGTNLPDARIYEQIEQLNEDFRRKPGTPGFSTDPRSADAGIEFYLACQDPAGRPTNGIIRLRGGQEGYTVGDNAAIKTQSLWPTNQYLNIWICNLTDFLGFGSFPLTDLPLGSTVFSRPDGVVVGYRYVGKSVLSNLYKGGRTITHEVGHFLGLLHIWGDGDCTATDYCDDTPPQAQDLQRCPSLGTDTTDLQCPGQLPIMYKNYMGYVYDRCMNIFTRDQVARMRYVLCNTPARDSLRILQPCITGVPPKAGPVIIIKNNPNPLGQFIFTSTDSGLARAEVYGLTGRHVGSYTLVVQSGQDNNLNLAPLAAGIYAVHITINGATSRVRFAVGTTYTDSK